MKHLCDELRECLSSKNYYAALTLALTLPDIAGWIREPEETSRKRYVAWWNDYVRPQYAHVEIAGGDAYALRCALLHSGSDVTEDQRAAEEIKRFKIVQPVVSTMRVHLNDFGTGMNIQVDTFCTEILTGIETFLGKVKSSPEMSARERSLMTIQFLDPSAGFSF